MCLLTAFDDGAGNSVIKICFNIVLSSVPRSLNWPSPFGFALSFVFISHRLMRAVCPPLISFFTLSLT